MMTDTGTLDIEAAEKRCVWQLDFLRRAQGHQDECPCDGCVLIRTDFPAAIVEIKRLKAELGKSHMPSRDISAEDLARGEIAMIRGLSDAP